MLDPCNCTTYYNLTIGKGEIMEQKMRKFIPLFVLVGLALVAAAIYIIVYHVGMPTRDLSGAPANFWWGLWQGLIIVLSFIASWFDNNIVPVSYTHLRAHETDSYLVCRLLLEKKNNNK